MIFYVKIRLMCFHSFTHRYALPCQSNITQRPRLTMLLLSLSRVIPVPFLSSVYIPHHTDTHTSVSLFSSALIMPASCFESAV